MKNNTILILFILSFATLHAQQKGESPWTKVSISPSKFLDLNWSKNMLTHTITTEGGFLPIEINIKSSDSVKAYMVKVYVNGIALGSKGDIVSLRGNPKESKELVYAQPLMLKEGSSKVEIEVSNTAGTKRTEPRFFYKNGQTIRWLDKETAAQQKAIWQSPFNPLESVDGKPFRVQQPEVEIKLIFTPPPDILGMFHQYIEQKDIILYLNNRIIPISGRAKLNRQGNSYFFKDYVMLDEKEDINQLLFIVKTPEMEMQSDPLLLNYRSFRPNVHVLSIGTRSNLEYTVKDATDFAQSYKNQGGKSGNKLFNSVTVDVLTEKEAEASEIRGRIEELKTKYETGNIKDNDLIILFVSAHGFMLNNELRLQGSDYSPSRQDETSVSFKRSILDKLEQIPIKKIIFLDACHSGGKGSVADINQEIGKLNRIQKGIVIVASSQEAEESYEDGKWKNGAFTHALLKGLNTSAADEDNNRIITLDELDKYLQTEVPRMVQEVKQKPQHPKMLNKELGNIAVFVRQ